MNVKNFVTTHKQGISLTVFFLSFFFLAGTFGGCENGDIGLLKCLILSIVALAAMGGALWYGRLWDFPLDMEEAEDEEDCWDEEENDTATIFEKVEVLRTMKDLFIKKEDDHEKRDI